MKKLTVGLLIFLFVANSFLCVSCHDNDAQSAITPAPRFDTIITDEVTNTPNFGDSPSLTVIAKVAHVLKNGDEVELYGAFEYENTGDCPAILNSAELSFEIEGASLAQEFNQIAQDKCVLYPGETSFMAVWFPYSQGDLNSAVSLGDITLEYERVDAMRVKLEVSDLFIARNYPSFATVTGEMTLPVGDEKSDLNVIYLGFYDDSDSLLGVWYFTQSSMLLPLEPVRFSTQMRNLQIENLEERTAQIKAVGFGLD